MIVDFEFLSPLPLRERDKGEGEAGKILHTLSKGERGLDIGESEERIY